MAGEYDGPGTEAVKIVCPLHCRLRNGFPSENPPGDRASVHVRVDWAGLPVDLDLVFSPQQRDKVYAQHLMRKRQAQLWRWLHTGAQVCVCEMAVQDENLGPDAA